MASQKMEPFRIEVDVSLHDTVELTASDLMEVRRLAYLQDQHNDDPLDNEFLMTDLINELVESKLDLYTMERWDFDWDGVPWETLINAVKGLDADGVPMPPPEIPGQITIDDILSELV